MSRTSEDEQSEYICGQCGLAIPHLKSESAPDICPECGWQHHTRNKYDVPDTIQVELN